MERNEYRVALAGNPNVGKTSIFNRLTGAFEHVGNWHGVTVTKAERTIRLHDKTVAISDLPGLYSLCVYSPEEAVTKCEVLSGVYDVTVCVCDANNLARNLYLAVQLIEAHIPIIIAVNMMQELKKSGRMLDLKLLEQKLGVPVVGVNAVKKKGTEELSTVLSDYLNSNNPKSQAKKVSNKLIAPDEAITKFSENASVKRYQYIDSILDVCFNSASKSAYGQSKIDKITLNKYLALPIFLVILALIFYITFGFLGKILSNGFDALIQICLYNPVLNALTNVGCPAWLTALVCEGIIVGVGGILTFLPQIVLLFFFLALLEDSGYLSRVAFMTDGLFNKIGLSGRAGFTMLMGFGCSATAVLTSRGLEDENMRKKTILLTPFFSCSARLPVYSVIASAYFSAGSPLIIFSMYLLGILVSILIAFILEKGTKRLKSGQGTFIMEMPPYRLPTGERVLQIIKNNVKVFLIRVGTVIFALNVMVWVLSNFALIHGFTHGTEYKSILETLSSIIAPIFKPLGFSGWEAVTALLSGIVAKEIVISSIESMGGVSAIFSGEYASASALSFMVFTLLYIPCIATIVAIKKETNTRIMLLSIVIQLATAYICAFIIYNIALLFYTNLSLAISIVVIIPILIVTALGLRAFIKNRKRCPYGCTSCSGDCKKN